ncbi:hypothetical protein LR948_11130 [Roseivivax sp. GX 12232]|uniref:hypothetical protein n=1 Tax=Roseivivax sp. GX 12232 TaxID=2900547 RepID=UPI001E6163AE|nr:hypothetical protein [Roseivivax sp. GX 12232]MCE0505912.1 hypothetical protein [Roseivivax sp. GX 12232]
MTRHVILAKPQWQPHATSPVLLAMPLAELQALDSLIEFMTEHGCTNLGQSDCQVWARLNEGAASLALAITAMENTDGPDAAPLDVLRKAQNALSACEDFRGVPRETRRKYTRSISLHLEDLPDDWRHHLAHIRDRIDDGEIKLAPDIYERMTRKICQYGWFLQQAGSALDFDIPSLRDFYTYETTRISNRGSPLSLATVVATMSDLRDFLRFSRAYPKRLSKEMGRLLRKLREREAEETSRKFAALAAIDITTIHPRAQAILDAVARYPNPAQRLIQRNRALAIAVPPLTPLRREWHDLRFGRDLVWTEGRYRLRDYKLRKTRHRLGRETYPGSVHPDVQHFVDARLLQDDDPRYLDALRAAAEEQEWPLFQHPDGSFVSANYVSQVWSSEFGTGAHICRSIVYDVVFAISEEATLAGMLLNDHTSRQARKKYTGDRAKQAALAAAGQELNDIAAKFGL